jgi:hypothetical protein
MCCTSCAPPAIGRQRMQAQASPELMGAVVSRQAGIRTARRSAIVSSWTFQAIPMR